MRVSVVMLLALVACDGALGLHSAVLADGPPPPEVVLVQQITNTTGTGSFADLQATLPATAASGDLLVMIGGAQNAAISAVDGAADHWTSAAMSNVNNDFELWYAIANGSGQDVLIHANTAGPMWMAVTEWSGVNATNPVDAAQTNGSHAAGSAATSPIAATSMPDLVIFAVQDSDGISGSPSGAAWASLAGISFTGALGVMDDSTWYVVADQPSAVTPSIDLPGPWDALLVAFRLGS